MCLSVMPLTGLEQSTRRDSKFIFWVFTLLGKTQSMSGPIGDDKYTHLILKNSNNLWNSTLVLVED